MIETDLTGAAYRFEVHRGKFEKSSKEWRQAHATPSLRHDDP
jgi:hypothetical protein